ncbi:MAG: NADH-quinone oxidoreductase subunit M [Candidatus Caenarcaniphilales bacterium]|nr:NADH-quinone oxidoreductase subunit M [Candidatus Caenarcaniphilales bacterium]
MEFLVEHSLSFQLLVLLVTALLVSFAPLKEREARITSLSGSIVVLIVALLQYFKFFDSSNPDMQLVESFPWIGGINFALGVDGLAFSMVLLMAILLPCVIIASKPIAQKQKPRLYYSLLLFLSIAVLAVFMAKDIFLFFLAWELELVPMYFLIAIWGSKNRNYASMKFLLYTFAAGACLLVAIFTLLAYTGFASFDMQELAGIAQSLALPVQTLLFVLISVCFVIKLPSVPFHTWLPDAHVEAPTPVSMMLAGILLKMGCYGLIRFSTEFFPTILENFAPAIAIIGAINIVFGAYSALIQTDFKKIIAYSSISHMGFILLGLAGLNTAGYSGAAFQMFSHGLISAALFMIVGMIYERSHTRELEDFGGLAKVMPRTFFIFKLAAMANLGLPGVSGFVGESLVFYGAFTSAYTGAGLSAIKISTVVSSVSLVLTAAYMLWTNQRVFYGEILEKNTVLTDARKSEVFVLAVLLGLAILYGVYPNFINALYEPQLDALLKTF